MSRTWDVNIKGRMCGDLLTPGSAVLMPAAIFVAHHVTRQEVECPRKYVCCVAIGRSQLINHGHCCYDNKHQHQEGLRCQTPGKHNWCVSRTGAFSRGSATMEITTHAGLNIFTQLQCNLLLFEISRKMWKKTIKESAVSMVEYIRTSGLSYKHRFDPRKQTVHKNIYYSVAKIFKEQFPSLNTRGYASWQWVRSKAWCIDV